MEALVVVVVLDPGAADEGDAPVDDDDLAVIEMAEVVEPPVDPPLPQQAVEVEETALVGSDLDPALAQLAVQRLRAEAGLAVGRSTISRTGTPSHLADQEVAEARRSRRP